VAYNQLIYEISEKKASKRLTTAIINTIVFLIASFFFSGLYLTLTRFSLLPSGFTVLIRFLLFPILGDPFLLIIYGGIAFVLILFHFLPRSSAFYIEQGQFLTLKNTLGPLSKRNHISITEVDYITVETVTHTSSSSETSSVSIWYTYRIRVIFKSEMDFQAKTIYSSRDKAKTDFIANKLSKACNIPYKKS
jgi:hypothetical protein